MTTLREEIEQTLHEYYNDERQPTHKITENILKLFEKRIDAWFNAKSAMVDNDYAMGYCQALYEIKGLLK